MEGFVLGIIDFHSKETALWFMILMYVVNHVIQILLELIALEHRYIVHLFALIFLFPAILTTDNMWRMLRVLITILILTVAFGAFQNVNADSYGDCNVAILSLWIILIYLSVLRVAYHLWMLLQAGLFSCCYCERVNDPCDTIKETNGAGFGEDKDLGSTFIGTSYFASFAKRAEKRLGDNVFESKPSEMGSKKKQRNTSPPPPSPPRVNSPTHNGTSRLDSDVIAAMPSDLGAHIGTSRLDTDVIAAMPSDLGTRSVELGPMDHTSL